MLVEIRATTPDNPGLPELSIPLFDNYGPIQVSFVEGLSPVQAEHSSSPYANVDGEYFQGSRVGPRNIVLTLELDSGFPDRSVESLRKELYGYFAPGRRVNLTFVRDELLHNMDTYNRLIDGVVESFEAPLFVEQPAVQISVLCYDPYFRSGRVRTINGDILNYPDPWPLFSYSDIPMGVFLRTSFDGSGTPGDEMVFRIGSETLRVFTAFKMTDRVDIDTKPFQKFVRLQSGENLLHARTGDWPTLKPGHNDVMVTIPKADPSVEGSFQLQVQERFIGL